MTLGYLAAAATIVVVGRKRVPGAQRLLAGYAATAAGVLCCARAGGRGASAGMLRVRAVTPLACAALLFYPSGAQSLALHGRLLDEEMLAAERRVLRRPFNLLLDSVVSRPLNEVLTACYSSFYLYFLVPPVYLMARDRDRDLERYVLAFCLAQYSCYLGFATLPLAGPVASLRDVFSTPHLRGYLVVPAQQWLMERADPPGTCFPSSHVAGAWAAGFAARHAVPRSAACALTALTCALTCSVVYCRYHYLVDALAGVAVARLAYRAATYILDRPGAP
ncbi:phosphatase PAP2 family protein [Streptomyces erythrochromogenes]|uniref:phosphatase PAP2 family protein n=1 Tax=Streptomyces erythrochromogenes TaxID=285574 RepID=UPI00341EC5D7